MDSGQPYFSDMARYPLLTPEEEIQIAKRIEICHGKLAQALLRNPRIILLVTDRKEQPRLERLCRRMKQK